MKKAIFIVALLMINLGFSQDYTESFTAAIATEGEDFSAPSFNADELDVLGVSTNMEIGEIKFNAPNKVDYINIYNSDNQEIFSALGIIINDNKIDVSFLPSGTYYLEVVIGKNMGTHKLIKQ